VFLKLRNDEPLGQQIYQAFRRAILAGAMAPGSLCSTRSPSTWAIGPEVMGANAGVHVLLWLTGVRARAVVRIVERAAGGGVGVYPVAPYYLEAPRRAGLLLGYASMTEREIRAGIRRLAAVLP
jgi:DNA-binding transcriptional MocR family regulator